MSPPGFLFADHAGGVDRNARLLDRIARGVARHPPLGRLDADRPRGQQGLHGARGHVPGEARRHLALRHRGLALPLRPRGPGRNIRLLVRLVELDGRLRGHRRLAGAGAVVPGGDLGQARRARRRHLPSRRRGRGARARVGGEHARPATHDVGGICHRGDAARPARRLHAAPVRHRRVVGRVLHGHARRRGSALGRVEARTRVALRHVLDVARGRDVRNLHPRVPRSRTRLGPRAPRSRRLLARRLRRVPARCGWSRRGDRDRP